MFFFCCKRDPYFKPEIDNVNISRAQFDLYRALDSGAALQSKRLLASHALDWWRDVAPELQTLDDGLWQASQATEQELQYKSRFDLKVGSIFV